MHIQKTPISTAILTTLLLAALCLGACKSDKDRLNEKFVAQVEKEQLSNFLNIEYIQDEELETFHYFLGDTLHAVWQYSNASMTFVNYDSVRIRTFAANPLQYITELRAKIKRLNVDLISQTQWKGQVVKFWINDTEYFTYVHPAFRFDHGTKTLLENELKNSKKVMENWYYKKKIVCTNK